MLDITVCSTKNSIIKFTKYQTLDKNSQPKGTTAFYFAFD